MQNMQQEMELMIREKEELLVAANKAREDEKLAKAENNKLHTILKRHRKKAQEHPLNHSQRGEIRHQHSMVFEDTASLASFGDLPNAGMEFVCFLYDTFLGDMSRRGPGSRRKSLSPNKGKLNTDLSSWYKLYKLMDLLSRKGTYKEVLSDTIQ